MHDERIDCIHVRGHQDDKKETELTQHEKWNVIADELADCGMKKHLRKIHLPGHVTSLVISGNLITTDHNQQIKHAFTSPHMQSYLTKKHHLSHENLQNVDFDAVAANLK